MTSARHLVRLFATLASTIVLWLANPAIPLYAQSPGDASGDGTVTVQDVALILDHLLGRAPLAGESMTRADANGDGVLDMADLVRIQADPLPPEKVFMLPGGVPLTMVRIPRGSFLMGSVQSEVDEGWAYPEELPRHPVTIEYDFYMAKFETTQRQWLAVTGNNPAYFTPPSYTEDLNRPVEQVSWNDIVNYCLPALNNRGLDGTFRLPSEAEWEYAARGGTQTRFHFGDSNCVYYSNADCDLSLYAWWGGNNGVNENPFGTKPAGGKLPNAHGLHDTAGNVWEWCADHWHGTYADAPADGSAWTIPASPFRVVHGGFWLNAPISCRAADRAYNDPDNRFNAMGFRLAWTP